MMKIKIKLPKEWKKIVTIQQKDHGMRWQYLVRIGL